MSHLNKQNDFWGQVRTHYKLKGKIGQGRFATVFRAKCRATGEHVAIKHLTDPQNAVREILILLGLKSIPEGKKTHFFAKLIDVILPEGQTENIFLVLELEQMDLNTFLVGHQKFDDKAIKLVFYNLLCAVNFLHSANVIHRDLKPANVLINQCC